MNSHDAWERFLQSGQVADYLSYAAGARSGKAFWGQEATDADADHDARPCHPGEKSG